MNERTCTVKKALCRLTVDSRTLLGLKCPNKVFLNVAACASKHMSTVPLR